MIRAFHTSATGMNAQQLVVDNTANNLANVNTTSFKRSQMDFQDLLYLKARQPGTEFLDGQQVPTGLQIGNGVRVSGNTKLFTQGALEKTDDPFHVAIEGEGFFRLLDAEGQDVYTRDGSFHIDAQGRIVNGDGYLLEGAPTVPDDAVEVAIGADGTISVRTAGQAAAEELGQITLSRFPNPAGLSAEGGNIYRETSASGTPQQGTPGEQGMGRLRQGHLERSNVEVVRELVNLIQAQRAYEFNTRAIRVADEMLSETSQVVR